MSQPQTQPEPISMIADVKIRTADGVTSVLVNGEEMNMQIVRDGFGVTFPQEPDDAARVSMTLWSDVEIDLPAAEVEVR